MKKIIKIILIILLLPFVLLLAACNINFLGKSTSETPTTEVTKPSKRKKASEIKSSYKTLNALSQPNKEKYKVISVADGDTLTVRTSKNQDIRVRFYGIDTPETLKSKNANELAQLENLYAHKARDYLREFVANTGNEVYIQRISSDKYGRVVAIVYTSDGTILNDEMVKKGLGLVWYITNDKTKKTYLTKDDFQREYLKILLASQQKARSKREGFWKESKLSNVFFQRSSIDF